MSFQFSIIIIRCLVLNENLFRSSSVHAILVTVMRSRPIVISFIYFNKPTIFENRFAFIRCLMPSITYTALFPLDPGFPLHMLFTYVASFHCPNGILSQGSGGGSM